MLRAAGCRQKIESPPTALPLLGPGSLIRPPLTARAAEHLRSAPRRHPAGRLFAAALDGDQRAVRVLRALADDHTTASDTDASQADRALLALDRPGLNPCGRVGRGRGPASGVWATGYVDQLLARYRDEKQPAGSPVAA